MKASRLLLAIVFVVSIAVAAKADGTDPTIITHTDPSETVTAYEGGPLTESFTATGFSMVLQDDETQNLDSLTLNLTGVPVGDLFECFTNIWVECTSGTTAIDSENDTETVTFQFDDLFDGGTAGSSGPCQNNGSAGGTCPGFLVKGDEFSLALVTPEPSTAGLLLCGLIPLFLVGTRHKANRPTA